MCMSESAKSSCSGMKGERRPLTVLALELVRGRNVVQASKSSLLCELGLPGHLLYWEPGLSAPASGPPWRANCRNEKLVNPLTLARIPRETFWKFYLEKLFKDIYTQKSFTFLRILWIRCVKTYSFFLNFISAWWPDQNIQGYIQNMWRLSRFNQD